MFDVFSYYFLINSCRTNKVSIRPYSISSPIYSFQVIKFAFQRIRSIAFHDSNNITHIHFRRNRYQSMYVIIFTVDFYPFKFRIEFFCFPYFHEQVSHYSWIQDFSPILRYYHDMILTMVDCMSLFLVFHLFV